uniref:HSF-type DNA-binding domain-containing protein n=1 Tax=Pseudo-nitzschia australis TaxID=44445 RepID=A0A7S4EFW0_9STRA
MIQDLWNVNEQRNLAPLTVPAASSAGSVRVVSGSGFRYVIPFPYRLHEMLSNVDTLHDSSIVSWLPDGRHFKVHDPLRFVESVIPSAFKQKSLKSFQRQLHLYGFQRIHEGPDKGAYYHEKFRRDDRDLCLSITRAKAPKRSRAAPVKTTTNNKNFSRRMPTFHVRKKSMETSVVNSSLSTPPIPAINMSAVTIFPSIFDDVSPPQQSLMSENRCRMRGPLHTPTPSTADQISSSTSHRDTSNITFPQEIKNNQQLDDSVADTCQWLINAGVPISAFDPVAIGDISHSSALPLLVPSASSSFSPVVRQKTTIQEMQPRNVLFTSQTTSVENNRMEEQRLNSNGSNNRNDDFTSLFSVDVPSHNFPVSVSSFLDEPVSFDSDHLLAADLLPGEHLPLVDDSLWAL